MHKAMIFALAAIVLPTAATAQAPAGLLRAAPAMTPVALLTPAPTARYAPVIRHWPSRALPDQPTMAERLKAVAPVKRYGRGWRISD